MRGGFHRQYIIEKMYEDDRPVIDWGPDQVVPDRLQIQAAVCLLVGAFFALLGWMA